MQRMLICVVLVVVSGLLSGGCIGVEVGPGGVEAGAGVGPFKVIKAEAK